MKQSLSENIIAISQRACLKMGLPNSWMVKKGRVFSSEMTRPTWRFSGWKNHRRNPESRNKTCWYNGDIVRYWLVVTGTWISWLSIYWECHHPNWLIFCRGSETTNQDTIGHNRDKLAYCVATSRCDVTIDDGWLDFSAKQLVNVVIYPAYDPFFNSWKKPRFNPFSQCKIPPWSPFLSTCPIHSGPLRGV